MLVKLQSQPGIVKEVTSLASKGYWDACNNIRFVYGYPQKIGGWTLDNGAVTEALQPTQGQAVPAVFWGVARSLYNWLTLAGNNLLGIGTSLKYYVQNGSGGSIYDITPIRLTTAAGAVSFSASVGLTYLTVTATADGTVPSAFVTFSGAIGLGGNITAAVLNREYEVLAVIDANNFTVALPSGVTPNASDTGNGGAAIVGAFQPNPASAIYTPTIGWGAGGWGGTTIGYAATTGWAQASSVAPTKTPIQLWSQSSYGQNLIFNARGGPIYYWVVAANSVTFNLAQQIGPSNTATQDGVAYWQTDAGGAACPTIANFVLVSDQSRFVIAFGTDNNGNGAQDPLLVSWSDQENITVWYPSPTNQAGNYRLSTGSQIICAKQIQQQILVWTDTALYAMQYLGPPYVWGFQPLGLNITIAGPNAAVFANNVMYWMGIDKFYVFNGTVNPLPCSIRKYVFDNINLLQASQFFGGLNAAYNEIWWFYATANSNTINSYVIYNYVDNTWAYGSMARTAWLYASLRNSPMAAGYATDGVNGNLIYHESGVDDGTTTPASPITSFIQSSDVDIGEGDRYGFVWRIIPDITFNYSTAVNPSVGMTIWPRQNPGTAYNPNATEPAVTGTQNYVATTYYEVQQFTQQINVRVRGRQLAFRVDCNTLGTQWQLGIPRAEIRSDGRRS
jgi:hypothetical protein